MTSRSDIVKLSDADLAWLRPGDRHGDAIRWPMSRARRSWSSPTATPQPRGTPGAGSCASRGRRVDRVEVDTAELEDAFRAGLRHAMTDRDLLARRTDRHRQRAAPSNPAALVPLAGPLRLIRCRVRANKDDPGAA
ncbi:hypothetical protein OPAG_05207 [Rhodococcus opacus PD630]|uniref:hypothetical protein n=1 Tax=Rhodococcus TaxID=1827 RepID=UPI00029CC941|nr:MULTISPECIES: hypothetical protein [Rhodococcus]EHI45173.1 hypothetical protein OPAG_05207 [Rhodococcus opacus PD630]PBC53481.1 hypothetical protein CJ177_30815 [Rhodococcus sp. ACPA1]UDG94358.1 hypothetical protein K2Z90_004384 [Rhodococcus opacus PD630]